jgi:hypothetical protein
LTIEQVENLKKLDNDNPVERQTIKVGGSGKFEKLLTLRQNDVLLVKLDRIIKNN